MTGRPDPWRSWLVAVLLLELLGGIAYGGLSWAFWNIDFGNDAAGTTPSWSPGPWPLVAATATCAALWAAAVVLTIRKTRAARFSLATIAAVHVAAAATVPGDIFVFVALLACGALIATLAVFPTTT